MSPKIFGIFSFQTKSKVKSKYEFFLRAVAGLIFVLFLAQIVFQCFNNSYNNFWYLFFIFLPALPLGFFALFGGDLALWLAVTIPVFFYVLLGVLNFLKPHADL